jgi:peptide deformylase
MQYNLVKLEDIPLSTKNPLDEIDIVEVFKICNQMENICRRNNGIGLSAVQIGLPWDFFVVNRNDSFEYYLNCKYEPSGDRVVSIEGCLSLLDDLGGIKRFETQRHSSVLVKGQRVSFQDRISIDDFSSLEEGLYSIVFQHEIDHSFGVFIKDIGKEVYLS